MRNVKFILSAIAILLAGAIAAGLAARAVTAPGASEVRSAGTVSIPAVLGQTAEEVLFYPWSLYDTENLYPLPDEARFALFGTALEEWSPAELTTIGDFCGQLDLKEAAAWLCPFELPAGPVECDISALSKALEWNVDVDGRDPAGGNHVFLDRFPARLQDSGTDVTLSMAVNGSSNGLREDYSFLLRPAQPREITEEEQRSALTQVKEELLDLLLNAPYFNYELTDEELYHLWLVKPGELTPEYNPADMGEAPAGSGEPGTAIPRPDGEGSALGRMLRNYLRPVGSYCREEAAYQLMYLFPSRNQSDLIWYNLSEAPTLDDLLAITEDMGLSVQIITTQEQIVVLFNRSGDTILGVYYDIQLGCWSGIGWRVGG